jgi:hypothetical protein
MENCGLEAQHLPVLPQQPHAQRVEGADHHLLGRPPDQRLGPLAHLGRRLVGERDGQDALGVHPGLDQARDLVRDHPRLARARAREHQAGALQEIDGILLREVQAGHAGGGNCWRGRAGERRMIAAGPLQPGDKVPPRVAPTIHAVLGILQVTFPFFALVLCGYLAAGAACCRSTRSAG